MKTTQQWLDEYGESHQNKTNKAVHWICVPAIMYSLIGLLVSVPFLFAYKSLFANWASVVYVFALLFYLRLSFNLFLGFAVIMALMIYANWMVFSSGANLPFISIIIFTSAWIGQFWGHKIEGKKPSFLKDLQFLLIGPAWLLHFVYQKLGIKY